MAPTFQAAGTFQAGGAVQLTVPWPTHQADDIGFLFVCSAVNVGLLTAEGFVEAADSPQAATGVGLQVFWKRATGASEASPVTNTGSNNITAVILTVRGAVTTGDPWDVTAGATGPLATSVSIVGDTSTIADCLILYACGRSSDAAADQFSGEADSNVTNLTERVDNGTLIGNGGGIGLFTANKVAAGTYGPMTATLAVTGSKGYWSAAIPPADSGVTGTVAVTLADATSAASGTVANPVTGTSTQTLADFTSAATGTETMSGTSAQTLSDFTSTASGTVANPVTGTATPTLEDFTSTAAGTTGVTGSAAPVLGDATSTASGTETFTGTATPTLADFTSAGSGMVANPITGTVAVTLGDFTSAASGDETITGTSAQTLADFTSAASGTSTDGVTGTVAVTLADFTSAATGAETITGSAAVTLEDFTSTASGTTATSVTGTAAVTLEDFTSAAAGTVTGASIILPPVVTIRDADPQAGVGDADPGAKVKTGNREAVLVRRVRGGTIS